LSSLVNKTKCEAVVWQIEERGVLFAVNNTTAGYEYFENPLANTVRNRIETIAVD